MEGIMRIRVSHSQFHGEQRRNYRMTPDEEVVMKTIAKMFREIAHIKPPRGRTGRLLPFEEHFAVRITNSRNNYTPQTVYSDIEQTPTSLDQEMNELGFHKPRDIRRWTNDGDLDRLREWHIKHRQKSKLENAVNSFADLISGLMGYGVEELRVKEEGLYRPSYVATMKFRGLTVTIKEEGDD
jgi:hypothetical protein